MDLPATQAMDGYDDIVATQKLSDDEEEETLVGTLRIGDKSYPIVSGVTTIGRHPESKIHTNHETVSKQHAEIEASSARGSIFIKDLNSSNRTKLNNSRLKPNCMYQIRDGDVLTFGQVVAVFKVYSPLDDSITPCTPQVKKEVKSVIPGTPDSSMDVSYNSEGDVSAIPGTQTDDNDKCFRRPKVPGRASMSNDSIKLNLSDVPSPLSKSQTKGDFSGAETRRLSASGSRDDLEEDIFDMETQKPAYHECNDSSENILEMETQRPSNNDIHNLETQRCSSRKSEIVKGSDNILSPTASMRKSLPAGRTHESFDDFETQRFNVHSSRNSIRDGISDIETQRFDCRDSVSGRKSGLEQGISNASRVSGNQSVCNLESRNDVVEKIILEEKSMDESIYDCVTQKDVPEELFEDEFNNIETQRFDINKSKLDNRKSINSSIYDAQTQPNTPVSSGRYSKNIEVGKLNDRRNTIHETNESADVSIYSAETQKIVCETPHNASISDVETQRFDSKQTDNSVLSDQGEMDIGESFEDLETQVFESTKSTSIAEKSICESIQHVNIERVSSTPMKSVRNSNLNMTDSRRSEIFRSPLPSPSVKRSSIKPMHHTTPKKRESEIRDGEVDQSMDNLETQKFNIEQRKTLTSASNASSSYLTHGSLQVDGDGRVDVVDQSMEDLETQKFCTRNLDSSSLSPVERKCSIDSGMKKADQSGRKSHMESIQDIETQSFCNEDSDILSSRSSTPRKSMESMHKISLTSKQTPDQSIEDLETQNFVSDEAEKFSRPSSTRKSNIESQTRKSVSIGGKSTTKSASSNLISQSIDEAEIQKCNDMESRKSAILSGVSRKSVLIEEQLKDNEGFAQSIEDLETQTVHPSGKKSLNLSRNSLRDTKSFSKTEDDECLEDLETQELYDRPPSAVIDETTDDVDSQGISFSIQDMETMPFMNETLPIDRSMKNQTIQNSNLTDQVSKQEKIDVSNEECKQEVHSHSKVKENESIPELGDQIHQNSSFVHQVAIEKSVLEDDDEDMFLSQNLIEDCPMAYFGDDDNEAATEIKSAEKVPNNEKSVNNTLVSEPADHVEELKDSKRVNHGSEDSETDEEGLFSCHLSKGGDDSTHRTRDDGAEEIGSFAKRGNVSQNDSRKENDADTPGRENTLGSERAEKDDSETDEEGVFSNSISRQENDDSETDEEGVFSNSISRQENEKSASMKQVNIDETKASAVLSDDEFATDEELFEDDCISKRRSVASLAPDSTANQSQSKMDDAPSRDLVPQKVDHFVDDRVAQSSLAENSDKPPNTSEEDDEFIAPTQIVHKRKSQTLDPDDMHAAPTQVASKQSFDEQNGEHCNEIDTRRSQITDLDKGPNTLEPTQIIDKETETMIDKEDVREPSLSSKRSIEELEIANSKRFKNADTSSQSQVDFNSTVEKNLDQMFEGPEEKIPENESVLLTQQLANILESSQSESVPQVEQNLMSPSPTLGSRRSRARTKSRKTFNEEMSSATPKSKSNLNDTVEKNLNELFQNSVNSVEEYETDGLMTQQLKNILFSQDDDQSLNATPSNLRENPGTPSANATRTSRSSLATRKSSAALSQRQSTSRRSTLLNKQVDESKREASLQEHIEVEKEAQACADGESKDENNVLERSQSDGEMLKNSRRSIAYRHATVGFLSDLSPITTSEKVGFAMTEGRALSSDSQSEGEDLQTAVRKRFNLSLAKSVNLNSSMSSLGDKDERIGRTSITQSPKSSTGNSEDQQSAERKVMKKRSLARGTRGFSSTHEPVDASDLVSAYSTESEDNQSPRKKVCIDDDLSMSPVKSNPSPGKARDSASDDDDEIADSDDDFLKNLPTPKVAGTAECPPTDSQLAAPSDHEDEVPIESQPIVIPNQWKLYSAKRFDLIYRGNRDDKEDNKDEDEAETRENQQPVGQESRAETEDGAQESHQQKIQSINELLAKIESESSRVSVGRKSLVRVSNSDSDATNENENPNSASRKSLRKSRNLRRSSSKTDQDNLDGLESQQSQQVVPSDASDQENSSDEDFGVATRKYKPLPRLDINAFLPKDQLDDTDQDLNELKQMCVKMYVGPAGQNARVAGSSSLQVTKNQDLSPILTSSRRRQQKRSALPKLNSNNSRARSSVGCKPNEKRDGDVADQEEDSALKSSVVFQGSEANSARKSSGSTSTTTTTSKTSGQTSNLNKRSVAPQDDAQNQLPKRTKLARDDEIFKKLSVVISPLQERLFHRKNIVAHERIVLKQSPASQLLKDMKAAGTPKALADVDARDDETCKSNLRGQGRRAASGKRRKNENSDVPSNNSSKENLEVDDSDAHSGAKRTRVQIDKSKKNVSNVTVKNPKGDEKSPSQDPKKKRGRPRKDQSMDSSMDSSNVEADTRKSETPSQGAKKKHGRPRKDQSARDTSADQSRVKLEATEKSDREVVRKRGRARKDSSRDESLGRKNVESTSSSRSRSNQATESQLNKLSRVSCVSGRTRRGAKAKGDEPATNISKNDQKSSRNRADHSSTTAPKGTIRRNQRRNELVEKITEEKNETIVLDDDSDSEAEFCVSKDDKNRNLKEEKVYQVEVTNTRRNRAISTKSVKEETSTRSTRGRRGIHKNNLESKESQNTVLETKDKQIKSLGESSESQEEMIPKGTRSRPAKSTKSSKSADTAQKSKVTKGRRGRSRKQSTSSIHSEGSAQNSVDDQNRADEDKNPQSVRQARKRAASPVKPSECSSEESQEVAEIMQKTVEKDNLNSRARKDKGHTETRDSSRKQKLTDNVEFEKPTSRPKRGKVESSEKSLLDQPVKNNESSEPSSSLRPSRRKNNEQQALPSSAALSKQENHLDSHKILYLGKQAKIRQIIKKLGGSQTEDPMECSILVSDNVLKTFEFLCPLLRGIPIVSTKWLEDSNKTKRFVDWKDYVLEDHAAESQYGFNLRESLEKARDHKVLDGYTLFLTPTITEPTVSQMKELINLCGGKPIVKAPTRWSAKILVIVEVGNLQSAKKQLTKAPKTVKTYSTELILTGILRQNVDLDEYKIVL